MWSILLNPKVILGIVVAAIIAFIALTFQQNAHLKDELQARDDTIATLSVDIGKLKDGQVNLQNDIIGLDAIANWKSTVVVRERALDSSTRDIPVTLNDAPFSDPNNMLYARRLRDFQQQSIDGSAPTNQPD